MKKYVRYIIPSVMTFIILGIIYYFNGLYPFGSKPLVQVDADYIYIPILYKIYDLLHHGGSLIYSDIGLGNSIYASLIIQGSLFSPLNLLLFLVGRDNLVNFFGVFIIIKLCLLSLTSYIYLDDRYKKLNNLYRVLFSLLYTFNGFIILNYFNHIWLDIVILFPLLMMYLNRLLKNNGELGYIIILSLCFIITFYYSYFIIIFILFYSFMYLNTNFVVKKMEIVYKLGKSTLIAFFISAFSSIPLLYQILISERFNSGSSTGVFSNLPMKSLYLLFSPLLILLFIKLMRSYHRDRKRVFMYFILVVLYLIPVIIDPINALIHGGSYWSFPYRYGFITSFILLDGCAYYTYRYNKDLKTKINYMEILSFITIIWLGIFSVFLNIQDRKDIIGDGILLTIHDNIYNKIIIMVVVVFLMYLMIIFIQNKYLKRIAICFVTLFSIFLFTSWTIYYNSGYFLCANARAVGNNVNLIKDGRYKVEYTTHTPYYGYMYDVSALDNWLHVIPVGEVDTYKKLGYHTSGTTIHSYGGTVFSDWLLDLGNVFANKEKINDNMYTEISKYNGKYLYKANYKNNNGVVFNKIITLEEDDKFKYQNMIYRSLFARKKDIIKTDDYNYENVNYVNVKYEIDEPGYLYLNANKDDNVDYITIDGNYLYSFDDYIKYLGYYEDDINIKIYLHEHKNVKFSLGFIKKNDIMELRSNVDKISDNEYYVKAKEGQYLFLPINNIPGISVYNNGKDIETYKYLDNFIYIKLNEGDNNIKIKYELPYLKISILISIIGIVLLIINNKIGYNNLILNISYAIYIMVIIVVFLYFYVYSFFKYLM